jgi:hypothetical protein
LECRRKHNVLHQSGSVRPLCLEPAPLSHQIGSLTVVLACAMRGLFRPCHRISEPPSAPSAEKDNSVNPQMNIDFLHCIQFMSRYFCGLVPHRMKMMPIVQESSPPSGFSLNLPDSVLKAQIEYIELYCRTPQINTIELCNWGRRR